MNKALLNNHTSIPLSASGIAAKGIPAGSTTPFTTASDVSVAIITRNRIADLRVLLAELNRQRYIPRTIIVIDNASADDTSGIAEEYSGRIPLRYFRCEEIGVNPARNMALHRCGTRYIAFIDDDAIPDKEWLAELQAMINSNPGAAAIVGVKDNYYPDELIPSVIQFTSRDIAMDRDRLGERVLSPTIMDTCNLLLDLETLKRHNLSFAGGFSRGEDRHLGHQLMHRNLPIIFAERSIVWHKWPRGLRAYVRLRWLGGQAPLHIRMSIGERTYKADTQQRNEHFRIGALLRRRIPSCWPFTKRALFVALVAAGIIISKCGYHYARIFYHRHDT
ncbi:MAG: glycosyltransferase [Chitinivibrionales bacterium]|nr:glycosyltransferase [Chitinivibrionales bacterium]MBD3357182.1 glycosyltransferase [Chitinivibrionales bacterium]